MDYLDSTRTMKKVHGRLIHGHELQLVITKKKFGSIYIPRKMFVGEHLLSEEMSDSLHTQVLEGKTFLLEAVRKRSSKVYKLLFPDLQFRCSFDKKLYFVPDFHSDIKSM